MTKLTLIITEKPSVAKALADWLSRQLRTPAVPIGRTHIEVGNYRLSWLFGHVLENFKPHEYDMRFKNWNMSDLPIIPPVWKLRPRDELDKKTKKPTGKPDPGAVAQINAIKGLLREVTEVIGAGDADQEGQLLQDEVLIYLSNKLPVKRLWLSAIDDASIKKSWDGMKPNSAYAGFYWAALARSHADWIAGINMSRACTVCSRVNGGNAVLSFGRVQTPTLALVVLQERLIRAFKPVDYYTPFISLATTPEFTASWAPDKDTDPRLDPEGRLLDSKKADAIVAACKAAGKATVTKVDEKPGKENTPLPFALSTLQEHMSKKFSMGVQDTLKFAQQLYEKKISTYPRTDCEYLPVAQHAEADDILKAMRAGVRELGPAPAKANTAIKSRAFDDKKVSAHHAIVPRPTTLAALGELTSDERMVWMEIAKRYLLQFFPAAEFMTSEIELLAAAEKFRVKGKVYTARGWKDAFVEPTAVVAKPAGEDDDEDDKSTKLPKVALGQELKISEAGTDRTRTKAPKRFDEGSLVAAMKNVHKYVHDPKLKTILRDNVGMGTEATRANIIGELYKREFMILDKKEIKPTKLGEELIDVLPTQVSAPDMTALWQQAMDDIHKTEEVGYKNFIAAQRKWLGELVTEVPGWFAGKSMSSKAGAKSGGLKTKPTKHTCLKCSAPLVHVEGKFGWFFGCSDGSCKEIFKDVGGVPTPKAPPTPKLTIGTLSSDDKCPACSKGKMQSRTCGPATKTPGKQFLSCTNFFATGKDKCTHSVWPK